MKRLMVILVCVSVFYAAAVWALEGCRDIGSGHELFHQTESAVSDHHDKDTASHHSHSDPTRVHCPNLIGEFLVSSRVTLTSDHGYGRYVALPGGSVQDYLSDIVFGGFGDGPPGPLLSKTFPRYLVLSVIRI